MSSTKEPFFPVIGLGCYSGLFTQWLVFVTCNCNLKTWNSPMMVSFNWPHWPRLLTLIDVLHSWKLFQHVQYNSKWLHNHTEWIILHIMNWWIVDFLLHHAFLHFLVLLWLLFKPHLLLFGYGHCASVGLPLLFMYNIISISAAFLQNIE